MGVVHRDIKPANLLIDHEGHLWVTDFGLAMTQSDANLTMSGDLLGTLRYMSPEQASGKHMILDHRTDIYSLGITLYELLTAQPAFGGNERQKLLRQIDAEEPPTLRSIHAAIPKDLETIVLKSIAKEPNSRYQSAAEMAEDLRRFLEQKPIRARRVTRWERTWRWAKRNPLVAALVTAVASLLVFIAIAGALVGWRQMALAEEMRHKLYVSDVRNAYQAWEEAKTALVRDLLSRHIPKMGQDDLRGFDWHYLWTKLQSVSLIPVLRHSDDDTGVNGVAFSPDGNLLATGGTNATVKLWDLRLPRSKLIATLRSPAHDIRCVAFSPTSQLVCAGADRVITLWDVTTQKRLAALEGHAGSVRSVDFSPDGQTLASASDDGTVKIWDVESLDLRTTLGESLSNVNAVAYSPGGNSLLASGSHDGSVRLWDVATGKQFCKADHGGRVDCLSFAMDKKTFATGGPGGMTLWKFEDADKTLRLVRSFAARNVTSLVFTSDGKTLCAASRDRTVTLWSVTSGEQLATIVGHLDDIRALTLSPDDRTLATGCGDGTAMLWRTDDYLPIQGTLRRSNWRTPVAFSPDGQTLVAGSGMFLLESEPEPGDIRLFDLSSGRKRMLARQEPSVVALAISPQGILATGGGHMSPAIGQIKLWDLASGTRLSKRESATDLAWSLGRVWSLAFSPDGQRLAAGGGRWSGQGQIKLWDMSKHELLAQFPCGPLPVGSLAFSPDGNYLAAGSYFWEGNNLTIWDMRSMKQWKGLEEKEEVFSVAFSPDGKTLATGNVDDLVRLWDVASGTLRHKLSGHSLWVWAVAFSPDGKTLASSSDDGTVRLWHADTGEELAMLKSRRPIVSLAFSPDGTTLAGGGFDTSITLWHAGLEKHNWPVSLR